MPDVLSVVKDSRVFFLLLSSIKVAPQKRDNELLEDPLQEAPPDELVLPFEVFCIFMIWVITHPVYVVKFELLQHHHSWESFKTVEFHKLVNFLVEDLLVLVAARQKVVRKNLSNELCQEVANLNVCWITFLKELLENLSSRRRICCLLKQFQLASFPIWR